MARSLTWLHLSDVHRGCRGEDRDWPALRDRWREDLRHVAEEVVGAEPDLVLFTGDLAFRGEASELHAARSEVLAVPDEVFGRELPLFAVPGNHDLCRPIGREPSFMWLHGNEPVYRKQREPLWTSDSERLDSLRRLFGPWEDFVDAHVLGRWPSKVAKGILPGDIAGTFEKDGLKLGLLGLNSAWRQFMEGDFEGRVDVLPQQLNALLPGGDGEEYKKAHDLVLLLQHHPPQWLCEHELYETQVECIADAVLFGHTHMNAADASRSEKDGARRRCQATSLFGLESYLAGEKNEKRVFGYRWGRLELDDTQRLHVRTWARAHDGQKLDHAGGAYREKQGFPLIEHLTRRRAVDPNPAASEPQPAAPERPAALEGYLSWGERSYRHVRLVGFEDRDRVRLSLDEVFVNLNVMVNRRTFGRDEAEGGKPLDADEMHGADSERTDLVGALAAVRERDQKGLLILGDPGAGKTTLLKHLFVRARREGSEALGLSADLVPVFVRLSRVGADDVAGGAGSLARFLTRELTALGYADAGQALGSEKRPLLLLLDGLDEMADHEERGRLGTWLDDELERWPEETLCVVTCRYAAHRGEVRLPMTFLAADLEWMDEPQVRTFVGRWFGEVERKLGGTRADAERQTGELLEVLFEDQRRTNYRLREMTRNPLLLSTICLVQRERDDLPDRRIDLYNHCVGLLLEGWSKHRRREAGERGRVRAGRVNEAQAREVLMPLAWELMVRGERSLPKDEVAAIVAETLAQIPGLDLEAGEFLAEMHGTSGLLAEREMGAYEFLHLSFQEYLAATHAVARGMVAEVAPHVGDSWWRETVHLILAQSGTLAQLVRALAAEPGRIAACEEALRECLDEAVRVDPGPFRVVLEGGSDVDRAAVGRLLRTPSVITGDAVAKAAAATVGGAAEVWSPAEQATLEAGHRRHEPVSDSDLLWVPAATFWMGSSKKKKQRNYDAEAYDDELPAHEVTVSHGFWIGRHPVTNRQFDACVQAKKVGEPLYWNNSRFNEPEQPVVGVGWQDSLDYCRWLTDESELHPGARFDLPTEAEWELAARGTDGRKWPWGNEPKPDPERIHARAYGKMDGPAPVGGRPAGASPVGAEDMVGNVWEWCLDPWRDSYADDEGGVVDRYTDVSTIVDNEGRPLSTIADNGEPSLAGGPRVLRGGSWWFRESWLLRCAARVRFSPGYRNSSVGFRVCLRVSREHVD